MRPLEQQTIGQRVALTLVIVVAILLMLSFIGWITGGWDEVPAQAQPDLYARVEFDAKLLQLDKRALDEAYHAQILHLWTIWLKQGAGDATQFSNGLRIARRAYAQAAQQIARREEQIK